MVQTTSRRKFRLLIAEDDPVQARLVEEVLQREGFGVCGPFTRCCEAADAARTLDIDAALLDVSLEGGTSSAAATHLKERGIPFAFLTGYGPETAPVIGAFSDRLAIPKPVTPEIMMEVIKALLSNERRQADYFN